MLAPINIIKISRKTCLGFYIKRTLRLFHATSNFS